MEGDAADRVVMDCQGGRTSDAIAWWIGADLPIKAIVRGRPFLPGSAQASKCGRQGQRVARLPQPRNARGQYQRPRKTQASKCGQV